MHKSIYIYVYIYDRPHVVMYENFNTPNYMIHVKILVYKYK